MKQIGNMPAARPAMTAEAVAQALSGRKADGRTLIEAASFTGSSVSSPPLGVNPILRPLRSRPKSWSPPDKMDAVAGQASVRPPRASSVSAHPIRKGLDRKPYPQA